MGDGTWEFRAVEGDVAVGDGVVRIESSPGSRLAGAVARWRENDVSEAVRVVATVLALAFFLALLGWYGYRLVRGGAGDFEVPVIVAAVGLVQVGANLWRATRDRTIPFEAIQGARLDPESRTLVVETGGDDRFLESLRWDDDDLTLRLLTDEDVRDARDSLRLKGVPLTVGRDGETETTHRVETRKGAVFCERCDSQVSPADATCPACGYAIRVAKDAESDDRERQFEYSLDRK